LKRRTTTDTFITLFAERFIFPILLLAFALLFFTRIKKAFDGIVVDKILVTLLPTLLIDLAVFAIVLSMLLWCIYLYKKDHYLSNRFYFLAAGVTGLYLIARTTNAYQFYCFSFMPVKYADAGLIVFLSITVIKIKNWKDRQYQRSGTDDPFLVDLPIANKEEDKFNRARFAADIAKRIEAQVIGSAPLAIGINGIWGSGKTSFMNLIHQELAGQKQIIIDFNPWMSASAPSIIPHFFEALSNQITPFDSRLKRLIKTYGSSISEIPDNNILKSGWNTVTHLITGEGVSVDHEKVNKAIQKIKKQIVVFIDDLDRLDHREVIEVLKLIRNTANFNNIIYVAAYDRGYVNEAIKQYNSYNHQQFVDKIFDIEFSLPIYESTYISEYIRTMLFNKLEAKFHQDLTAIINRKEYNGSSFTQALLNTKRDALRFCNSFLFDMGPVREEVDVRDFYLLQLLKLKFKVVFDALATGKYRFFVHSTDRRFTEMIQFRSQKDAEKTAEMITIEKVFDKNIKPEKNERLVIDDFLDDLSNSGLIQPGDKLIILLILKILVPEQDKTLPFFHTKKISLKSFSFPRNYHKYFSYHLFEGDISEFELESYRTGPFEPFLAKVKEWLEKGKKEALRERLRPINEFSNVQDFENFVRVGFYIGRIDFNSLDWMSHEYQYLLNVLAYPMKESIYLYPDKGDYETFLTTLFEEAPTPAIFESSVISTLISTHSPIVMSWEKLSALNRKYFFHYADGIAEISHSFWTLFGNCKIMTDSSGEDPIADPEARTYANRRYKELTHAKDLGVFIRQTHPYSTFFMFNKDMCNFVASSMEALADWVATSPYIDQTSAGYLEFRQFFEKSQAADFKPVEFSFTQLQPNVYG
jgi:hypothetical protein